MDKLEKRQQAGCRLAKHAGEILRQFYGNLDGYQLKGPTDPVSEADQASESYLVESLHKAFPEDSIVGEEEGQYHCGGSGYLWVIDPLDGTTNFVHNHPHFAVSIGLVYDHKPVFGAVYAPIYDELYQATRRQGALLNGAPLQVSQKATLRASLLATGFPYVREDRLTTIMPKVERVLMSAHGLRRAGSAALDLCYVAAGRLDGYWEGFLHAWDIAAGALIVAEAGGLVTGFDGQACDFFRGEVVASNGIIHDKLMAVLFPEVK